VKAAKYPVSDKTMGDSYEVKVDKEGEGFLAGGGSLIRILHTGLRADPQLVSRFWTELVDPLRVKASDITAVYCRFVSQGQTCLAVEFVAGETLEQFVGTIDPAAGERMTPLFSTVLDSFDERQKGASASEVRAVQKLAQHDEAVEVMDLGVIRALAAVPCARQQGTVVIEGGRIKAAQIHGDGDTVVNPVGSLALFADQQHSQSFRSANIPGGIGEMVITSVLSNRQSYWLAQGEQASVPPSEADVSVPPRLEEVKAVQAARAVKTRPLGPWWIGIGIAATLAVGALLAVLRRAPTPLSAPAVHASPEVRRELTPAELTPAELIAAAPEIQADPSPKPAAKRERKSLKRTVGSPKEEARRSDLVQREAAPESVTQAPAMEETRPSDSAQGEAAPDAVVQVEAPTKEPATENEADPGAKKRPGRFIGRAIGRIFSLGRHKKEGTPSHERAGKDAHKQE
jgi:hypothetical protein